MSFLRKEFKIIFFSLSLLIITAVLLFLINQVYQVYVLASSVNDSFGLVVLILLSTFMVGLIAVPLTLYFNLPQTLVPPTAPDDLPAHRRKLLGRLQSNSFLKACDKVPKTDEQLDEALQLLKEEADERIRKTALAVFLTTSVSQNGKLDAFTVLFTHSRLIWRIAYLYNQRPRVKDLVRLYANVGATAFLVSEIEDFDITIHIESLISGITKGKGSPVSSIPFVGPAATLVMDSLFEGSANAFLTLRVGIIARKYCSSTAVWQRDKVRRSATLEAAKMLNSIVAKGSAKVISGVVVAAKNAGVSTLQSGGKAMVKAGVKIKDGITYTAKKVNPFGWNKVAKSGEVPE